MHTKSIQNEGQQRQYMLRKGKEIHLALIRDIGSQKQRGRGDDGNEYGRQYPVFCSFGIGSAFLRSFPFLYSKGINEEGDRIG